MSATAGFADVPVTWASLPDAKLLINSFIFAWIRISEALLDLWCIAYALLAPEGSRAIRRAVVVLDSQRTTTRRSVRLTDRWPGQ